MTSPQVELTTPPQAIVAEPIIPKAKRGSPEWIAEQRANIAKMERETKAKAAEAKSLVKTLSGEITKAEKASVEERVSTCKHIGDLRRDADNTLANMAPWLLVLKKAEFGIYAGSKGNTVTLKVAGEKESFKGSWQQFLKQYLGSISTKTVERAITRVQYALPADHEYHAEPAPKATRKARVAENENEAAVVIEGSTAENDLADAVKDTAHVISASANHKSAVAWFSNEMDSILTTGQEKTREEAFCALVTELATSLGLTGKVDLPSVPLMSVATAGS